VVQSRDYGLELPHNVLAMSQWPSATKQRTSWRLLIRCWTSHTCMEQSVNPAARVGHYTRTISTITQSASIWSLTAAAPSDSVNHVLCTDLLAYLLTYFCNAKQSKKSSLQHIPLASAPCSLVCPSILSLPIGLTGEQKDLLEN